MFLPVDDIPPDIVDILLLLLKNLQLLVQPLLGNVHLGLSVSQVVCCPAGELSDDGVITAGDLEDVEVLQTPDGEALTGLELEVVVVPGDPGLRRGVDLTLELQATLGLEGDVRLDHLHLGGVKNVQAEDISGSGVAHSIGGLAHNVSSILPGDVLQQYPGLSQSPGQDLSFSPPDHLRLWHSGPRAPQGKLRPQLHCQVRSLRNLYSWSLQNDQLILDVHHDSILELHGADKVATIRGGDVTYHQISVLYVEPPVNSDSERPSEENPASIAPDPDPTVQVMTGQLNIFSR